MKHLITTKHIALKAYVPANSGDLPAVLCCSMLFLELGGELKGEGGELHATPRKSGRTRGPASTPKKPHQSSLALYLLT